MKPLRLLKRTRSDDMKRPCIGIVPLIDVARESYWMLPGYMKGIEEAKGLPIMLPLTDDVDEIRQLVDLCDGFLFTGGPDISPQLYGESDTEHVIDPCEARDRMEHCLFHEVWKINKPILGICRGIQFINVALGGTLLRDIPTQSLSDCEHHQNAPYHKPSHEIIIDKNSPLYNVIQNDIIHVNSCHHQAIQQLAKECKTMAVATDGLVEAIYCPSHTFVWGVQWHPEFSYQTDENSRLIFHALVNASS